MLRFFTLFLLFVTLYSCSNHEPTVRGRSSVRVLFVRATEGEDAQVAKQLAAQLDTMTTDGWQLETVYNDTLLYEDSIHLFSAIILGGLDLDALGQGQRIAIQRYAEAGGGLLIADLDSLPPYEWAWYQQLREDHQSNALRLNNVKLRLAEDRLGDFIDSKALIGSNVFDLSLCTTPPAPSADQFNLEILDADIYEPMEMEVLPFGEVLFLERRGKMKYYDPVRKATRLVHDFAVCTEGNYEDGLHGLELDPDYGKTNHWIYLYYTPAPCDSTDQLLSRFEFRDGVLDTTSEVVVLRVGVQRETCCHSGGAVEFGPDGLLYLSTGDNTSSKESDGYTPIDERPGRGPFDAQKSSGNTHDLRGKILRIRPEADGTYSIPEGNLFPADGSDGRPEIYAMGCRNPFRIAIDPETNYLYWGDVGPDVGEDGRYGPQSYDEWNQARTAGNFGWPYFVGDNFAYPDRDFATDEVGALFDPARPINESPYNTGRRELPPAQPALIWYPYGPSEEFPQLGQGSRSAMAGPWYTRRNQVPVTNLALPDYYVGKWFIYEWARSWIKVVTFDSARQEVIQIEDFLPELPISKPIDMEFGPDGAMYLLEYGNDYFLNNPDARLVRITYSAGNRPPRANIIASETAGGIPFNAHFRAVATDPDPQDSLRYRWLINGVEQAGTDSVFTAVFRKPGNFEVSCSVSDRKGATVTTRQSISVGNAPPILALSGVKNQSFLLPGQRQLRYRFTPVDPEDEAGGGIDPNRALVSAALIDDADLIGQLRRGEAELPSGPLEYVRGAKLIDGSDCYTCHRMEGENVGPSFLALADHYEDTEANYATLATKIIKGGNGNWGERLMSGHPTLSPEDAGLMAAYILSLNDRSPLPLAGKIGLPNNPDGAAYVLAATYRDGGSSTAAPLTRQRALVLRPPHLEAESAADELYRAHVPLGGEHHAFEVVTFRPGGHLKMARTDLTGLRHLVLGLHPYEHGRIELRYDAPNGPKLAESHFPPQHDWYKRERIDLRLPPTVVDTLGPRDLYLVWLGPDGKATDDMGHHRPADAGWLDWIEVR